MKRQVIWLLVVLILWGLEECKAVKEMCPSENGAGLPAGAKCIHAGNPCTSDALCCTNSCEKAGDGCQCGHSSTGGKCTIHADCGSCPSPGISCRSYCQNGKCGCMCKPLPNTGGDVAHCPNSSTPTGTGASSGSCTYPLEELVPLGRVPLKCTASEYCTHCTDAKCDMICWDLPCGLENAGRAGGRAKCQEKSRRDNFTCNCLCKAKIGQLCETYRDCETCPYGCHRECYDAACAAKCPGSGDANCFSNCQTKPMDRTTCDCKCPVPVGGLCSKYDDCAVCPAGCDRQCEDTACTAQCPKVGARDCLATCDAEFGEGKGQGPTRCVCRCP